jgi:hypothetical protein
MPVDFRFKIVGIMVANTVTIISWYVDPEQFANFCLPLVLSIVFIRLSRQVYVVHGCVRQRVDITAAESQAKAALSDLSEQPMVESIAETNA